MHIPGRRPTKNELMDTITRMRAIDSQYKSVFETTIEFKTFRSWYIEHKNQKVHGNRIAWDTNDGPTGTAVRENLEWDESEKGRARKADDPIRGSGSGRYDCSIDTTAYDCSL